MSVLVRLVIDERSIIRRVRLPDLPLRGELIELADGTRVIVDRIVRGSAGGDEVEVRAKLA